MITESMARVAAGAIAFKRSGDPGAGEFDSAEVLQRVGAVPAEDALMGYD